MNPDATTAPRVTGTIVLVGESSVDILRAARALDAIAVTRVASGRNAADALGPLDVDVLVADERDLQRNGRQLLDDAALLCPDAVRIVLNAEVSTADGWPAIGNEMRLPAPLDVSALRALCAIALRCAAAMRAARELEGEVQRLRGAGGETAAAFDEVGELDRYEAILTRSPAMKQVLALLKRIEGSDATVLLQGETGTGKELVAQAIHARSSRASRRFVAVNLGAVSDHLRESELFGHVRGAFTNAVESRAGLFVEANGGTIFLDEVGDASPGLQVALLRVLEEGCITPVGSDRPRRIDVRVISGTNHNLEQLVQDGRFRRDLYYRLHVFPIHVPPLRERPEDVFPLALHFLALASHALGKRPPGISRDARAVLEAYHWEGNVRELRNVMERAAILCKGGLVIAADLQMRVDAPAGGGIPQAFIPIPPGGASLQQLERDIFVKTLELAGGNQSRAAGILGLCESTFRFRLRKLGLASRRTATPATQAATRTQQIASALLALALTHVVARAASLPLDCRSIAGF